MHRTKFKVILNVKENVNIIIPCFISFLCIRQKQNLHRAAPKNEIFIICQKNIFIMTQTSLIKSKACVQKFGKKHNKFKVPILFFKKKLFKTLNEWMNGNNINFAPFKNFLCYIIKHFQHNLYHSYYRVCNKTKKVKKSKKNFKNVWNSPCRFFIRSHLRISYSQEN